uniref:NSF attachment protein beta n=1 Tax=Acanthochromis polyacanthus TaxID=80966 RepID=A0A3Q1GN04_9TELE
MSLIKSGAKNFDWDIINVFIVDESADYVLNLLTDFFVCKIQVAMSTMDNPLLKYNAKEYFFKASLCHFIVDELNAKLAIEKYEEMFPAFTDSRELKLLKKLLEAHEEQNSEAFTEAVKEFDSVSRLDQWLTTMLLRIKKTIQGDAGDLK